MTTTETTTTTLAFHHLVDPHLGDQEASLDVHPHLPMTLTLLTTRLEDLHGFRTQDLLEVPELPTILTVTVDPLEGHLADLLEDCVRYYYLFRALKPIYIFNSDIHNPFSTYLTLCNFITPRNSQMAIIFFLFTVFLP